MRHFSNIIFPLALISTTLLVSGCASKKTEPLPEQILSGDQMLRTSEGMAHLGSRWQQGKQMVDNGQQIQLEGQAKIEEGRRLIEEGQKIMRESEEAYKNIKK